MISSELFIRLYFKIKFSKLRIIFALKTVLAFFSLLLTYQKKMCQQSRKANKPQTSRLDQFDCRYLTDTLLNAQTSILNLNVSQINSHKTLQQEN